MNLRVTSLAETPLLEIEGDIDHSTCGGVATALDEILDRGSPIVLIDLSRVAYLDSGGISVLLSGARRLRDSGWLGVIGPNSNVRRLLELVGLLVDPSFRSLDDRLAAEAALRLEDRA
ncbi:MAG: STAS domain-containing protein [Thermoleophilia bacterium]|nr:STAS domain-containing protein [Thermoleophilia bacterium]